MITNFLTCITHKTWTLTILAIKWYGNSDKVWFPSLLNRKNVAGLMYPSTRASLSDLLHETNPSALLFFYFHKYIFIFVIMQCQSTWQFHKWYHQNMSDLNMASLNFLVQATWMLEMKGKLRWMILCMHLVGTKVTVTSIPLACWKIWVKRTS